MMLTFFLSSRRRHTSCALVTRVQTCALPISHTWFVLSELLGYPKVYNYDGSWTEWGSMIGVPIENRSEERRVGKELSVRVDLGGRRIIKKKTHRSRDKHTLVNDRMHSSSGNDKR